MIGPDELARAALFAGLSDEQLRAVAPLATPVAFAAGETIMAEGRAAEWCWLIRAGRVRLEIPFPNHGREVVQTLGSGDVLGWSWLLAPHTWRFDGVADDQVEAVRFDGVRLRALATDDPALGYPIALGVARMLADRLHATRARLVDLYGHPGAP